MSKALKVAAVVVGVAALAVTGIGLAVGAAAFTAAVGVSAATLSAALGVASSLLSIAAGITAKKPTFASLGGAGSQLDFTADPTAGQPYVMGNARVGEAVVHEASWGDKNKYLGIVGVLSCAGPIMAYDGLYADNAAISFSGGNAVGYYHDFLYEQTQLGARPEAAALAMTAPDASAMPDWGSGSKLSSLAASGLILVADTENGKIYSGGIPQLTHQLRGVLAYDPRLDSANGGAGTQRPGGAGQAETDYAYSANPWVHHGTYALGRWVNGVRVIGPGLPADYIDWPSHIDAANVADANGWTVSGRVLSTDNKWNVLKSIAQAGGGYPMPTGAKLACLVNTPRVSLETIEEEHLKGPVSVPQMAMRRSRLNGGIPRYREPSLGWEIVSGNAVRNSGYLSADGGTTRTREIDLPLVADKDQAAQLVAYEVANSRERSPIALTLDLYWSQYKMGDCLTLNIPSALLFNQKCVIISRELDAASNTVRFEFRTEDDAKHAWALGVGGGTVPTTTVGSDPGAGDNVPDATDTAAILRASYPKGMHVIASDAGGSATVNIGGGSTEMIANGDFSTTSDWTTYAGVTISGGVANASAAIQILTQNPPLIVGAEYTATFDYTMSAGSKLRITNGNVNGESIVFVSDALSSSGTITATFTAVGTYFSIEAEGSTFTGTIDNVSVLGGASGNFTMDYAKTPPLDVVVPPGALTGLAYSKLYYLYADVDSVGDTTPTYGATTNYGDALNSSAHPMRIFLNRSVTTPAAGGTPVAGGGTGGGAGGGFDLGDGSGLKAYP